MRNDAQIHLQDVISAWSDSTFTGHCKGEVVRFDRSGRQLFADDDACADRSEGRVPSAVRHQGQ
jgi:hypothetical protein